MVTRREAVAICLVAFACPFVARAQGKVPAVGLLWNDSAKPSRYRVVLVQALRELGYVEDQGIRFVDRIRFEGAYGRMQEGADELVRLGVDVIVTYGGTAALAAARATKKIPIVSVTGTDLVKAGLADSLARPGGNVTGVGTFSSDLVAKRIQLTQELVPGMSRLGLVWAAESTVGGTYLRQTEEAARSLKLQTLAVEVRRQDDLDEAFAKLVRWRADAMLMVPSTMLAAQSGRIAGLATKHRLPSVGPSAVFAQSGGLLSYAADERAAFNQAAAYVQRILKGAKPGDLPIDRASRFELIVNVKAAKAINLPVPHSILLRADRTIE